MIAAPVSVPLLEVVHLTRRFGALLAVNDVSLSVTAGQIFGIAGPNGSGKSTLFNIITGIPFGPSSGQILLEGRPIHTLRPHQISRAGILRTFQKDAEFATLSAFDNVYVSSVYCGGLSGAAARRGANEALESVSLPKSRYGYSATDLSAYERKQLMIASAIAGKPKILLLDEPAAGLTKPEVSALITLIRTVRDRGITVMLIEHVLPLLLTVSERLTVLNQGAIIAAGTPEEVVRQPEVIDAYLGKKELVL